MATSLTDAQVRQAIAQAQKELPQFKRDLEDYAGFCKLYDHFMPEITTGDALSAVIFSQLAMLSFKDEHVSSEAKLRCLNMLKEAINTENPTIMGIFVNEFLEPLKNSLISRKSTATLFGDKNDNFGKRAWDLILDCIYVWSEKSSDERISAAMYELMEKGITFPDKHVEFHTNLRNVKPGTKTTTTELAKPLTTPTPAPQPKELAKPPPPQPSKPSSNKPPTTDDQATHTNLRENRLLITEMILQNNEFPDFISEYLPQYKSLIHSAPEKLVPTNYELIYGQEFLKLYENQFSVGKITFPQLQQRMKEELEHIVNDRIHEVKASGGLKGSSIKVKQDPPKNQSNFQHTPVDSGVPTPYLGSPSLNPSKRELDGNVPKLNKLHLGSQTGLNGSRYEDSQRSRGDDKNRYGRD